jgi:hypothetical protein
MLVGRARGAASLGTLQKARSQVELGLSCAQSWRGRAGQAFVLVECGVVGRATANSSSRIAAGHNQDDQAAETKPPAGSCSRILDQGLGSTRCFSPPSDDFMSTLESKSERLARRMPVQPGCRSNRWLHASSSRLTIEQLRCIISVHHPPNRFAGWAAGPPRKGWP